MEIFKMPLPKKQLTHHSEQYCFIEKPQDRGMKWMETQQAMIENLSFHARGTCWAWVSTDSSKMYMYFMGIMKKIKMYKADNLINLLLYTTNTDQKKECRQT